MRRPPRCDACTEVLGRETRHSPRRYCSQVQIERRRAASPARLAAEAERQRRLRAARRDALDSEK